MYDGNYIPHVSFFQDIKLLICRHNDLTSRGWTICMVHPEVLLDKAWIRRHLQCNHKPSNDIFKIIIMTSWATALELSPFVSVAHRSQEPRLCNKCNENCLRKPIWCKTLSFRHICVFCPKSWLMLWQLNGWGMLWLQLFRPTTVLEPLCDDWVAHQ